MSVVVLLREESVRLCNGHTHHLAGACNVQCPKNLGVVRLYVKACPRAVLAELFDGRQGSELGVLFRDARGALQRGVTAGGEEEDGEYDRGDLAARAR